MDFSIEYIEDDLKNTLEKFFNEIELSFDYVSKETIHKLKCFLTKVKKDKNIYEFAKNTNVILKGYEDKIAYIITSKNKLKTSDFKFLEELCLFEGILEFKIFKDENKNTKKTIINYINNIYMAVSILEFGLEKTSKNFSEILDFVKNVNCLRNKKIENEIEDVEYVTENTSKKIDMNDILNSFTKDMNIKNIDFNNLQNITLDQLNLNNLDVLSKDIPAGLNNTLNGINDLEQCLKMFEENAKNNKNSEKSYGGSLPNMNNFGGFSDVFKSLMENKEIMNIASDLTNEIQTENLDPISLLSSLMSGKKDDKILGIVNNITTKLEEKINTGQIDKNVLEREAENILNKFKQPESEPVD
jgi:hypothetical protein